MTFVSEAQRAGVTFGELVLSMLVTVVLMGLSRGRGPADWAPYEY